LLKFGKPIVSTSANISGDITPGLFKEISKPILTGVDYIVQFDQTNNVEKSGSRIITEDADGIIKVIRD
ncbi:MAG: Sua5/YciO/YrdC/YwlC family protein, partial [Saprospiraceae bacterium]